MDARLVLEGNRLLPNELAVKKNERYLSRILFVLAPWWMRIPAFCDCSDDTGDRDQEAKILSLVWNKPSQMTIRLAVEIFSRKGLWP